MSNARNLANLLGTATTVQTAKIADDAITNAKLNDSGSFTVAGLTVSGTSTFQGTTTATSTTEGFGATGNLAAKSGSNLAFNSSSGALTAGSFVDGNGVTMTGGDATALAIALG